VRKTFRIEEASHRIVSKEKLHRHYHKLIVEAINKTQFLPGSFGSFLSFSDSALLLEHVLFVSNNVLRK
jgi:hypothetical protein